MHEESQRLRPITPEGQSRDFSQPHRKGRVRKVGWEDRRLFMTVSEKASGMAKRSLGEEEFWKEESTEKATLFTRPSLPVCPRETPSGGKARQSSSWREKRHQG